MRKTANTFMPSEVLDGIYDIISEHICIAGNEDIYLDDIIWLIVHFMDDISLLVIVICLPYGFDGNFSS